MNITLVILAAGRSRRFGRMKQIESIGPNAESLIEYTLFDAARAGFRKAVLVTNEEILPVLKYKLDNSKLTNDIDIEFILQEIAPGRKKPWGTGHAVLSACKEIKQPFAVVNGDDFYGFSVLQILCRSLYSSAPQANLAYLIGHRLGKTLSEHGENARGICTIDKEEMLNTVVERTNIFKSKQGIFTRSHAGRLHPLSPQTVVSMNCWGFPATFYSLLKPLYEDFIKKNQNDSDLEFFLPDAVNILISTKKIRIKVRVTEEEWFGITFPEDSIQVKKNIKQLITRGIYPGNL